MKTKAQTALDALCNPASNDKAVKFTATPTPKKCKWGTKRTSKNYADRNQHYFCTFERNGETVEADFFQSIHNTGKGIKPTVADVMHCLLTDASCYEGETNIDSFAANFAEGLPVSRVLEIYAGCKKASEDMRRFWGADYDKAQEAASEY